MTKGEDVVYLRIFHIGVSPPPKRTSMLAPFDLMSNREVLAKFDDRIKQSMRQYVASLSRKANFPVEYQ